MKEFTDAELQSLRAEYSGGDEGESAAEANADERDRRERAVAELRRYAEAVGVPEVRTLRDLLRFLVAADVVIEDAQGLALNPSAPLPGEVLPLTEEERLAHDELRWARIHEGLAQEIVRLFQPDSRVRVRSLFGSLADYAEKLAVAPYSVRAALQSLLREGDFSADTDVERVDGAREFTLSVDWEQFVASRIGVRGMHHPEEQQ